MKTCSDVRRKTRLRCAFLLKTCKVVLLSVAFTVLLHALKTIISSTTSVFELHVQNETLTKYDRGLCAMANCWRNKVSQRCQWNRFCLMVGLPDTFLQSTHTYDCRTRKIRRYLSRMFHMASAHSPIDCDLGDDRLGAQDGLGSETFGNVQAQRCS